MAGHHCYDVVSSSGEGWEGGLGVGLGCDGAAMNMKEHSCGWTQCGEYSGGVGNMGGVVT